VTDVTCGIKPKVERVCDLDYFRNEMRAEI
jgi:hypothetical protein